AGAAGRSTAGGWPSSRRRARSRSSPGARPTRSACWPTSRRSPGPATRRGPPVRMRRSIATVSLAGPLEAKLRAAAAAGFDGVELFEDDLLCCPRSPEEVAAIAGDLGLTIDL